MKNFLKKMISIINGTKSAIMTQLLCIKHRKFRKLINNVCLSKIYEFPHTHTINIKNCFIDENFELLMNNATHKFKEILIEYACLGEYMFISQINYIEFLYLMIQIETETYKFINKSLTRKNITYRTLFIESKLFNNEYNINILINNLLKFCSMQDFNNLSRKIRIINKFMVSDRSVYITNKHHELLCDINNICCYSNNIFIITDLSFSNRIKIFVKMYYYYKLYNKMPNVFIIMSKDSSITIHKMTINYKHFDLVIDKMKILEKLGEPKISKNIFKYHQTKININDFIEYNNYMNNKLIYVDIPIHNFRISYVKKIVDELIVDDSMSGKYNKKIKDTLKLFLE